MGFTTACIHADQQVTDIFFIFVPSGIMQSVNIVIDRHIGDFDLKQ